VAARLRGALRAAIGRGEPGLRSDDHRAPTVDGGVDGVEAASHSVTEHPPSGARVCLRGSVDEVAARALHEASRLTDVLVFLIEEDAQARRHAVLACVGLVVQATVGVGAAGGAVGDRVAAGALGEGRPGQFAVELHLSGARQVSLRGSVDEVPARAVHEAPRLANNLVVLHERDALQRRHAVLACVGAVVRAAVAVGAAGGAVGNLVAADTLGKRRPGLARRPDGQGAISQVQEPGV